MMKYSFGAILTLYAILIGACGTDSADSEPFQNSEASNEGQHIASQDKQPFSTMATQVQVQELRTDTEEKQSTDLLSFCWPWDLLKCTGELGGAGFVCLRIDDSKTAAACVLGLAAFVGDCHDCIGGALQAEFCGFAALAKVAGAPIPSSISGFCKGFPGF